MMLPASGLCGAEPAAALPAVVAPTVVTAAALPTAASGSTAATATSVVRVRRAPRPDAEGTICISPHSASKITVARGFALRLGPIPALPGRSRQPQQLARTQQVGGWPEELLGP